MSCIIRRLNIRLALALLFGAILCGTQMVYAKHSTGGYNSDSDNDCCPKRDTPGGPGLGDVTSGGNADLVGNLVNLVNPQTPSLGVDKERKRLPLAPTLQSASPNYNGSTCQTKTEKSSFDDGQEEEHALMLAKVYQKNDDLNQQIETLSSEVARLVQEKEDLTKKDHAWTTYFNQVAGVQTLSDFLSEVVSLRQNNAVLMREKQRLEKEIGPLKEEIVLLKAKLKAKEDRCNQLESILGWYQLAVPVLCAVVGVFVAALYAGRLVVAPQASIQRW